MYTDSRREISISPTCSHQRRHGQHPICLHPGPETSSSLAAELQSNLYGYRHPLPQLLAIEDN